MGAHMKTTIEISDELARLAKAHAARENETLRSLVERGLRMVLHAANRDDKFELRDASVGGRGLQPPFRDVEWRRMLEAAYKGRGS